MATSTGYTGPRLWVFIAKSARKIEEPPSIIDNILSKKSLFLACRNSADSWFLLRYWTMPLGALKKPTSFPFLSTPATSISLSLKEVWLGINGLNFLLCFTSGMASAVFGRKGELGHTRVAASSRAAACAPDRLSSLTCPDWSLRRVSLWPAQTEAPVNSGISKSVGRIATCLDLLVFAVLCCAVLCVGWHIL